MMTRVVVVAMVILCCLLIVYGQDTGGSTLSLSNASRSLPVEPSVPSSPTIDPTTISPGLSQPSSSSAAKFLVSTSQAISPTTLLRSASVIPPILPQPTPGKGCEETTCDCQFRLDKLTLGSIRESQHLIIVLAVFVFLCILLCCFMTACCIQCCVIRKQKRSKRPKTRVTKAAKAPSDENIYSDVVAAPPTRHEARREARNARRKISTATVNEMAYAGPEYCNSDAYRQNVHATHTF